jgi:hypothetical protein
MFAQNFDRQIHYTLYRKLTSSGAETGINFLLKNFAWTQVDGNFPEMFFRNAGDVGAGVVQSCRDGASNLGINVRPIGFQKFFYLTY